AGIRPVLTWKSTAAAPTPTRLGACAVPWALTPWQEEHDWVNSSLPWAMVWGDTGPGTAADAGLLGPGSAPEANPTVTSPSRTTAYPATGRRRSAVIQLTWFLGFASGRCGRPGRSH